ncbi:mannosyltransferase [Rhizoctonia solani AG-1 IA]|uniref:Mannosyltransferase n=1 Tax=Thanatephorus cucumeris (strain AG1-IA) TaxID=983506 RepID=L8WRB0_THACA|nr:mannosyltransferase [Rhizoctonia solani AG-1 IA]
MKSNLCEQLTGDRFQSTSTSLYGTHRPVQTAGVELGNIAIMGLLESLLQILQAILCGSGKADESHGQQQQQQQQQQQASAWQQPPGAAHQYPPTHHKPSKPYHARIDDNAQAQANPHYQELRSRAREEGNAMARAFDASQEAYQSGDGAKAKELSNEGKRHKAEMERLNKEASDWIFESKPRSTWTQRPMNLTCTPNINPGAAPGLYVKEAIERTEAAVEAAQSRGDEQIRIIVGKGDVQNHTSWNSPLGRYRLNAHIDPENTGVLVVQLGGHGQRGMDPNEVTRRLERDDEQCVSHVVKYSHIILIHNNHSRHVPHVVVGLTYITSSICFVPGSTRSCQTCAQKGYCTKAQVNCQQERGINRGRILSSLLVRSYPTLSYHLQLTPRQSNSGGGGERVLWASIAYLQRTNNQVLSVVYTGDTDATKEEIITKVKTRFDIILDPSSLEFVFLRERWVIEDTTWPRFTLIGQSLGSMMLAYEAMCGLIPDLFIAAYVHYPTISTDMLARVKSRTAQYNNPSDIAKSEFRTNSKLLYYNMFALAYSASLSLAQPIMVNSSWTKNHVEYLLTHSPVASESSKNLSIVYPPCDTQAMASFSLEGRKKIIMSLAQFRPEKDHAKQIIALAKLFEAHPEHKEQGVRLVLIGSSRNTADEYRVVALQDLVNKLNLDVCVSAFVKSPTF